MDYLDTRKQLQQHILLMIGYVLIAVAITMATLLLLNVAYGFGLGKDGTIVQNGLTFFSSHPNPADIYVNSKLESVKTNSRLELPSGIYDIKLARQGYHDWQRKIDLEGGSVQRYDYPFLVPKDLQTKTVRTFSGPPNLLTQSPDHRWLLVQPAGSLKSFLVYDLKNPDKNPVEFSLPDNVITKASGSENWQLGEWADDNDHVLLQHIYDGKTEYVLVNRTQPTESLNLNASLSANPAKLTLADRKYDKYYTYIQSGGRLDAVSLKDPAPKTVLQGVIAYKTYGRDTFLYVTGSGAPAGRVSVKLTKGDNTWTIRTLPVSPGYVIDLAGYSGDLYVAAGAAADNRVYIYKDPAGQIDTQGLKIPAPVQVLRVEQVNYLSFSASAQFIVAENGNHFGVYDIENEKGYNFTTTSPLDAPQIHATWMDGNRLTYVSNGKQLIFDYDNTNRRLLMPAQASYLPAFDIDYKYVYALPANAGGQNELTQTALLTPGDL